MSASCYRDFRSLKDKFILKWVWLLTHVLHMYMYIHVHNYMMYIYMYHSSVYVHAYNYV